MTTISLSRVTDKNKREPVSTDRTYRPTTAFKTTGRQTKAFWGNRFYKDVNDLNYDIKYDLIKGKGNLNQKLKFNHKLRRNTTANSTRKSSVRPSSSPAKSVFSTKNLQRQEFLKMNKLSNPEKYSVCEEQAYSTIQTNGLCKFEFEKTIQGRLAFKTNHHLHFQYQTERTKNENPVWYDNKVEINLKKMMKTINSNKIKKCHDFSSYTVRKVFEPREELDKFYNTRKAQFMCHPKKIKQTVEVDKITGRVEEKPKHSSKLAYNEYESRKTIQERPKSHEISKSVRVLKFSPQIISQARGCYR